jgi:hypothetical protein
MVLPGLYAASLSLFGFIILATLLVPNGVLLLACIPPAFLAFILGFVMFVYAFGTFGLAVSCGALVPPVIAVLLVRSRVTPGQVIAVIYGVLAVALPLAWFGMRLAYTEP